uniref:(California timema) hypothetical protein n=1 Tax=Timema californicum TaxID=61474 RepID=A0A7R9J3S4_TIMCA|nr:unnamed protein product [Timema californicum]
MLLSATGIGRIKQDWLRNWQEALDCDQGVTSDFLADSLNDPGTSNLQASILYFKKRQSKKNNVSLSTAEMTTRKEVDLATQEIIQVEQSQVVWRVTTAWANLVPLLDSIPDQLVKSVPGYETNQDSSVVEEWHAKSKVPYTGRDDYDAKCLVCDCHVNVSNKGGIALITMLILRVQEDVASAEVGESNVIAHEGVWCSAKSLLALKLHPLVPNIGLARRAGRRYKTIR